MSFVEVGKEEGENLCSRVEVGIELAVMLSVDELMCVQAGIVIEVVGVIFVPGLLLVSLILRNVCHRVVRSIPLLLPNDEFDRSKRFHVVKLVVGWLVVGRG
jgi:hypothetical protein